MKKNRSNNHQQQTVRRRLFTGWIKSYSTASKKIDAQLLLRKRGAIHYLPQQQEKKKIQRKFVSIQLHVTHKHTDRWLKF